MALSAWQDAATFEIKPADDQLRSITAPWLMALPQLGSATYLRLTAVPECGWEPLAGFPECDADGLPDMTLPDASLVLKDCAPGALIGRVGGSTATLTVADAEPTGSTKPFAVGNHCIIALPAKAVGPLFLGFNIRHRPVKLRLLRVQIATATGEP